MTKPEPVTDAGARARLREEAERHYLAAYKAEEQLPIVLRCDCGHDKKEHEFQNDRIYDVQWYDCKKCTCQDFRENRPASASLMLKAATELWIERLVVFAEEVAPLLAASPEAVSLILQCTACGCVFNPEPKKDACPQCRGLVFTIRGHSESRDTP